MQQFYAQKGIQMEPTAAYSAEANGIAERYNLTNLDLSLPMAADSGDAASGLAPLSDAWFGHAILYAADMHNAKPASGACWPRPTRRSSNALSPCHPSGGSAAAAGFTPLAARDKLAPRQSLRASWDLWRLSALGSTR